MLEWFKNAGTSLVNLFSGPRRSDDDERDYAPSPYGREKVKTAPKNIPAFLPWFDENQSLGETPEMRRAYRLMLADPNVKAAILSKLFGVMALDLTVSPARKKDARDGAIADFVRWNLADAMQEGVPGLIWDILSGAMIDGISICEPVWELEDEGKYRGKRYLRRLKALDVGSAVVPIIDEHRNIVAIRGLQYNAGEEWDPDEFVITQHLGLFENPLGMSDLRAAYGRWWILDSVTKLRAMGAERRAFGIVSAEYPDVTKQTSLEEALSNLRYRHWMAVPEGTKLQVLDLAGQSSSYFSEFRKDLQEEIFLAINGAILQATTSGAGQNRGASAVHKDTADLRAWHLRTMVTHVLNDHKRGLIRRMVDKNFLAVEGYPKASLGGVDEAELKESLAIDKDLKQAFGWKFNREELEERYGRKWEDDPEKALPDAPPPGMPGMGGMPGMDGGGMPAAPQGPQAGGGGDLPPPIVPSSKPDQFGENWDESKHPRAEDGKFGSGGGDAAPKQGGDNGGMTTNEEDDEDSLPAEDDIEWGQPLADIAQQWGDFTRIESIASSSLQDAAQAWQSAKGEVHPALLDSDGRPKVFWHGSTSKRITGNFRYDLGRHDFGHGVYSTTDPGYTMLYAGGGHEAETLADLRKANIIPIVIRLANPLIPEKAEMGVIDDAMQSMGQSPISDSYDRISSDAMEEFVTAVRNNTATFTKWAVSQGYDGVVTQYHESGGGGEGAGQTVAVSFQSSDAIPLENLAEGDSGGDYAPSAERYGKAKSKPDAAFSEEPQDGDDLAALYVDLLNALEESGEDYDDTLDAASDELDSMGWTLDQDDNGVWSAKRYGGSVAKFAESDWTKQQGPRGGTYWVNKANPNRKVYRKDNPGSTREDKAQRRRDRGIVDVDALRKRLTPHAGEQTKAEAKRTNAAYRTLKRHHGELTVHRLEELADTLQKALDGLPEGREGLMGEHLRRQLRGVGAMLDAANKDGVSGAVEGKGKAEPAPESAKAEAPSEAAPKVANAKSKLDLILDHVEKGGEITLRMDGPTSRETVEKVTASAAARGMTAAYDGNNFLIRKNSTPAAAKEPESASVGTAEPEAEKVAAPKAEVAEAVARDVANDKASQRGEPAPFKSDAKPVPKAESKPAVAAPPKVAAKAPAKAAPSKPAPKAAPAARVAPPKPAPSEVQEAAEIPDAKPSPKPAAKPAAPPPAASNDDDWGAVTQVEPGSAESISSTLQMDPQGDGVSERLDKVYDQVKSEVPNLTTARWKAFLQKAWDAKAVELQGINEVRHIHAAGGMDKVPIKSSGGMDRVLAYAIVKDPKKLQALIQSDLL